MVATRSSVIEPKAITEEEEEEEEEEDINPHLLGSDIFGGEKWNYSTLGCTARYSISIVRKMAALRLHFNQE